MCLENTFHAVHSYPLYLSMNCALPLFRSYSHGRKSATMRRPRKLLPFLCGVLFAFVFVRWTFRAPVIQPQSHSTSPQLRAEMVEAAQNTSPPPPSPMALLFDDGDGPSAAIKPTGTPIKIECALYAGPLRWRRHPGGRRAPQQTLRALPMHADKPRLSPPRRALFAFASSELRLLPGSPFAQASRTNAAFLRSLRQERLFFNFRALAGVPQPAGARPYGGWERPSAGIRGHFVGHYLSALATGGASGDDTLTLLARSALQVLVDCQRSYRAREPSHVGYLASFPPGEFDKVETLCHPGCDAWVPHYATQKLLTGLFALHTELGLAGALPLALGMAEYVWRRGAAVRESKGEAHWAELLNYEVGALSEVFVSAAIETGNASWLDAAALFDRRCLSGVLALAGALHGASTESVSAELVGLPSDAWAQGEAEAAAAESAIRGMHANAQLAYVVGLAARYEATGEPNARLAAEAYWRAVQTSHTYLAGGSSFMEEWRGAHALPNALVHRGAKNWAAHDHQESCVTHNHMGLSRKLLGWEGTLPSSIGRASQLHAHADYLDVALYNGVLGTQRGEQVGAMVYMMPLGGGVSKAGGNHGWSNGESHFWCCMGSAIEAFTRLPASVFYTRRAGRRGAHGAGDGAGLPPPRELIILQHVPARLAWPETNCNVTLSADVVGEVLAGKPLVSTVKLDHLFPFGPQERGRCRLRVRVRVPGWASRARAELVASDGPTVRALMGAVSPATFVSQDLGAGEAIRLSVWARTELKAPGGRRAGQRELSQRAASSADGGGPTLYGDGGAAVRRFRESTSRHDAHSAHGVLRGLTYGPILLAALTDGERTLRVLDDAQVEAWLQPVPATARRELATLELAAVRSQTSTPSATAASESDAIAEVRVAIERGVAQAAASAAPDGPRLPPPCSLWARPGASSAPLVLAHRGEQGRVGILPRPTQPPAPVNRRGGSDAVNAATWRIARSHAGGSAGDSAGSVVIEAFDRPGMLLTLGSPSDGKAPLLLMPARPSDARQRWRLRLLPPPARAAGCAHGGSAQALFVGLESLADGMWVRAAPNAPSPTEVDAATTTVGEAAVFILSQPLALYPPLAHWAFSNSSCTGVSTRAGAATRACRRAYLMFPLRDLIDETYSAHFCVLPPGAAHVPAFCH